MSSLYGIGIMSGTSLDGVDFCLVKFDHIGDNWKYRIVCAESEPYPSEMKDRLNNAQKLSAFEYAKLHSDYGSYLGAHINAFIVRNNANPSFIACHGQTIFHQPQIGLTSQIGSGACIAAATGIDTICDFRTTDVALGGQGAPLVPIGDRQLFGDYEYCLNLGGFSNISFEDGSTRRAYDICPVNYVLNSYMRSIGKDYDRDGEFARSGNVSPELLERLNALPFYSQSGPKSLGREWVESEVFPLIDSYDIPLQDKLRTFCEHVAIQISANAKRGRVLVTGGGAHNKFLMERFRAVSPQCEYVIPDDLTVDFKEALIFAFLGDLYIEDIPNCVSSVTGASRDCIGGCLYKGLR
jgi:anhydro-N-acetylmuramic acid kinase